MARVPRAALAALPTLRQWGHALKRALALTHALGETMSAAVAEPGTPLTAPATPLLLASSASSPALLPSRKHELATRPSLLLPPSYRPPRPSLPRAPPHHARPAAATSLAPMLMADDYYSALYALHCRRLLGLARSARALSTAFHEWHRNAQVLSWQAFFIRQAEAKLGGAGEADKTGHGRTAPSPATPATAHSTPIVVPRRARGTR